MFETPNVTGCIIKPLKSLREKALAGLSFEANLVGQQQHPFFVRDVEITDAGVEALNEEIEVGWTELVQILEFALFLKCF